MSHTWWVTASWQSKSHSQEPAGPPAVHLRTELRDLQLGFSQWKNLQGWWAVFGKSQMESSRNCGNKTPSLQVVRPGWHWVSTFFFGRQRKFRLSGLSVTSIFKGLNSHIKCLACFEEKRNLCNFFEKLWTLTLYICNYDKSSQRKPVSVSRE